MSSAPSPSRAAAVAGVQAGTSTETLRCRARSVRPGAWRDQDAGDHAERERDGDHAPVEAVERRRARIGCSSRWKLSAASAVDSDATITNRPAPRVDLAREHDDDRPVPEVRAVGDAAEVRDARVGQRAARRRSAARSERHDQRRGERDDRDAARDRRQVDGRRAEHDQRDQRGAAARPARAAKRRPLRHELRRDREERAREQLVRARVGAVVRAVEVRRARGAAPGGRRDDQRADASARSDPPLPAPREPRAARYRPLSSSGHAR